MKKKIVGFVGILALGSLCLAGNALAARSDEIQSRHIDEADGTSGQDTNSGSGVKTGHIQNGAVTDAKISGTISTSKLNVGTSAGTVAAGNHDHDGMYNKKPAKVVVVATSGGDFTSPIAAVNSITDASAATPYLVKVMPGVYDLGDASLQMKENVYLEGSGRENTTITSSVNNVDFDTCAEGTIVMAANTSVRNIRLANVAPDEGNMNMAQAIVVNNVEALIEDVTIRMGDNTIYSARNNGICAAGPNGNAVVNNVDIEVLTMGGHANAVIIGDGADMTITNSKLVARPANGDDTSTHVVDCCNFVGLESKVSNVKITDSYIESSDENAADGWFSALWMNDCVSNISNTTVRMTHTTGGSCGIDDWNNRFTMLNSQMYVTPGEYNDPLCVGDGEEPGKIANSLIQGPIRSSITIKLLNNFDENLNPIANR